MRERFDEFSNREVIGSTKLKDFKYLYPDILDFIEQEIRKEREENIAVIEIWFEGEMNENRGSRLVYEHLAESRDRIINTIKDRT